MSVVPVPVPVVRPVVRSVAESGSELEPESVPECIRIVGWPDPVIDRLGYDPRSLYVETFWLGIIGPTCTWLMRRFAAGLDDDPAGFDLDLADTARALGLGDRAGRQSPFRRALARCVTFEMARREGPTTLAVRRRIPPMPQRHLQRLPESLQNRHAHWMIPARSSPVLDEARRTARRLALALLASSHDRPEVELQLVRWQVHPAIAHEAAQWAWAYRAHETNATTSNRARTGGAVHAGRSVRPS
ncbi:MAG TPA: hypothetical protein VII76_15605 [Acidimicrobiales bacterium]